MLRTCLFVCSCLLIAAFIPASGIGQDSSSTIVFTGCPPYVEGNFCDSLFYQVVATDLKTGHSIPGIKYFLVSGPGTVDEHSGLWVYHPEQEIIPRNYIIFVEIGAVHGQTRTSSDENCRFPVNLTNRPPVLEDFCGVHLKVLPSDTIVIPLEVTDADWCDEAVIESVTMSPEPDGWFEYDSTSMIVRFSPSHTDSGQTFEIVVGYSSSLYVYYCSFYFDTYEREPIKLRIASEVFDEASLGDTVKIDVYFDELPIDLERLELLMNYDTDYLSFIEATPGTAFFSPDSGCGWYYFQGLPGNVCWPQSNNGIMLQVQSVDRWIVTDPICYRPDELPAVLATLSFVVSKEPTPGGQFLPVDFYWCNCSRNLIRAEDPKFLYMPSAVYSVDGVLIEPSGIPGRSGAGDECLLDYYLKYERARQIEFYNGGVQLNAEPVEPQYSVEIGYVRDQLQGHFSEVPIILNSIDTVRGIGGFDILVGYDASALVFQQALEGELYDSCSWEYFTYRFGANGNCDGNCPSGLLRVIGIAETNNGSVHPGCDEPSTGYVQSEQLPITIANLRFLITNDRTRAGEFIPISFFWNDCGDNILSNHDGSEAYLSARVFDENDSIINIDAEFPTWFGAQEECVSSDSLGGKIAIRYVDYHGGGIFIDGPTPIDATGDINLNGLAFEIADAVMFANYFITGLSAFGNHIEGSIAASDVNADGIVLSIADFVFLVRVITGDALPGSESLPSSNVAHFSQDLTGVISVNTLDSLGAVHMVVEGNVVVTLLADNMSLVYAADSTVTRILVYSLEPGQSISSGPIVALSGMSPIVEVNTATFSGGPVESVIDSVRQLPQYSVEIGYIRDQRQGEYAEIPITLHSVRADQGLAGFDFMFGYDTRALMFHVALQGDLYDSCGWEYFTYRYGNGVGCDIGCPSGMLRVVGIAETNNGAYHPQCNDPLPGYVQPEQLPITIAKLRFLVSNDRTLEGQFIPIRFFWTDCGDNVLANHDGSEAFLSAELYEFYRYNMPFTGPQIEGARDFPTFYGTEATLAAGECYHLDGGPKIATPNVQFQNGGIDIYYDYQFDATGDINLNGLKWEIADAVMFANYFVEGLAAFGNHVEGSIVASDCNTDGIALSVADFVYLMRKVMGDAEPNLGVSPSPNPAFFSFNQINHEVAVSTLDQLGAVRLVVQGEITPVLLAEGMTMGYAVDSGLTRILIYPGFQANVYISEGPLVSLPGSSEIVEVETATFLGRMVQSVVGDPTDVDEQPDNLPIEFALHSNYPNPFNPMTTIAYDLPRQAQVEIVIYNITGQEVKTLINETVGAGNHTVVWDSRDQSGDPVSSGIYFYRIKAGDYVDSRKMLLLK